MRDIADRFRRQSVAYSLASVVGPGTSVLLLPIYTRVLSPADYGLLALIEILALLFGTVFSLGMTANVPFYYTDERPADVRRASLGTLVMAVTAFNVALACLFWSIGPALVDLIVPSVPFHPYVPLLLLTALLEPYWIIPAAVLQIQERAFFYSLLSIGRIIVSIGLRIGLVVVVPWGVYGFVMANLLTAAIAALVTIPILVREISLRFDRGAFISALRVGLPTLPNNLLTYGFRGIDRVFLDRFVARDQIGLYYLALRVADIVRILAEICLASWRPVFFKEAEGPVFAGTIAPRVIRVLSVGFVAVFVALSLFAREIVGVLAAPGYAGAAAFVPLVVGAMVLKGIYSFPYLTVWYRKRTMYLPAVTGAALLFNVAANALLAPRFGAMGVALVQMLSYGLLLIIAFGVARRLYPIAYPWRQILTAAALGTAVVAFGHALGLGLMAFVAKLGLFSLFVAALIPVGCLQLSEVRGAMSPFALSGAREHV